MDDCFYPLAGHPKFYAVGQCCPVLGPQDRIRVAVYQRIHLIGLYVYSEAGRFCLVDQAIGQLPPQQKKVYTLSRIDRLKYDEIAEVLQISKATVKTHLQLAIASISSYIRANGETTLLLFYFFSQVVEKKCYPDSSFFT